MTAVQAALALAGALVLIEAFAFGSISLLRLFRGLS